MYSFTDIMHKCIGKVYRCQSNNQKPRTKGQTMVYRTLQRKLKIEQHELSKNIRQGKQFLLH